MNPEHPPLMKMLAALPLLRFGIHSPFNSEAWQKVDEYPFSTQFFDENAPKEDAILFAARLTSIALTLAFALAIALWTRVVFGPYVAIVALTLFVFDPTIIANGHYVKNDVAVALFAFLSCITWAEYLKVPTVRRLILSGLCLGAALATKFSALFLLPVLLILCLLYQWQTRAGPRGLNRRLLSLAAVIALAIVTVFLVYAVPALLRGVSTGGLDSPAFRDLFDRTRQGANMRPHGGPFTAHPYIVGLTRFLDHGTTGHRSYLFGRFSMDGWWYYFPVAFAVKTPVATLVVIGLAAWGGLKMLGRIRLRALKFEWFVLAVPLVVFCLFAFASRIDIGIRHLLPVWPFLFILSAAAFSRARFRHAPVILLVVVTILVAESISIFPHDLAFFNVLAGGPARGPAILADSNIDWGQDAKNLRDWLQAHPPSPRLCLDYWGNANIGRLGVHGPSLLEKWDAEHRIPVDCVAAVSVNFLYGHSPDRGNFELLRALPPAARIGYSIYVYDLPKLARQGLLPFSMQPFEPAFQGVLHQDLRGKPSTADPARPGEVLSFYMTDLGPVTPPVPAGSRASLTTLSHTVFPISCRWKTAAGWSEADVLFSGLAPGLTGIYQVNVRVAADAVSGEIACNSLLPSGAQSKTAFTMVSAADH